MWFNSMLREKPYQPLNLVDRYRDVSLEQSTAKTGVAWLSSARVVRCWVKSRNERNPHPYLPSGYAGNYKETASDKLEEGGDDVKSSWPLWVGLHTCYNGGYSRKRKSNLEQIPKSHLSSD